MVTIAMAFLVGGCGDESGSVGSDGLHVVRDTVGDTVVVRTLSGSVWGGPARLVPEVSIGSLDGPPEYVFGDLVSLAVGPDGTIYVVDAQGPDLRAYHPDGTFKATLARSGQGPGELSGPDGGMATLADGRIVVRDPGNARLQVFDSDGRPDAAWPWRGSLHTSRPLYVDRAGSSYSTVRMNLEAGFSERTTGLVRIGPDGVPRDTLRPPDTGYELPMVRVQDGGSSASYGVPFLPREGWALHPSGRFVHWVATDYAFTLDRPEGPIRVERAFDPVPVEAGEADQARAQITRNVRHMVSDWTWDGPRLPEAKAPFHTIRTGHDGRFWVRVATEAVHREAPDHDPEDPMSAPDSWREPVAYDVFEEDGTYLGRVEAPDDFALYPVPVFDGDRVWATTQDDLGVIRVVRYRVDHPPSP